MKNIVVVTTSNSTTYRASKLLVLSAVCSLLLANTAVFANTKNTTAQHAAALHSQLFVLDGHADVLLPETNRRYYTVDGHSRVNLAALQAGGIDALVLSLASGPGGETAADVATAQKALQQKQDWIAQFIASSDGQVQLATTAAEIRALQQQGKIAIILGFQNARSLGTEIDAFTPYYAAGVRIAGLTHAGHNAYAGSSRPVNEAAERHAGLSELGKTAITRFNELGVLVDVSQLTEKAALQAIALSKAPVIASHSNAKALSENSRNLSDRELDAIKVNGGLVQITPFHAYLRHASAAETSAISKLRQKYQLSAEFENRYDDVYETLAPEQVSAYAAELLVLPERANLDDYLNHIDYIVKRIGIEHVGIGSDFDHGAGIQGFNDYNDAPNLTAALLARGYNEQQIRAIWGENFLRVLSEVENAAKSTAKSAAERQAKSKV